MSINIILCGLGAVGITFATKFQNKSKLKILVDEARLEKLKSNPPIFNGKVCNFEYVLPNENFDADLIVITTKFSGLNDAVKNIKNFVGKNTYIISLINGISSEEIIAKTYGKDKVLYSYFVGHSAVREGNSVTQDGIGEIVLEKNDKVNKILKECQIDYSNPDDIMYSMWLKYTLNLFSNQTSAILNMTFGEMKKNTKFREFAKNIINEVKLIATKKGIKNLDKLETDAFAFLDRMVDDGKTSMLQDILQGRKTEVDIFAGEMLRLAEIYNVEIPYNKVLYELIKIKESL